MPLAGSPHASVLQNRSATSNPGGRRWPDARVLFRVVLPRGDPGSTTSEMQSCPVAVEASPGPSLHGQSPASTPSPPPPRRSTDVRPCTVVLSGTWHALTPSVRASAMGFSGSARGPGGRARWFWIATIARCFLLPSAIRARGFRLFSSGWKSPSPATQSLSPSRRSPGSCPARLRWRQPPLAVSPCRGRPRREGSRVWEQTGAAQLYAPPAAGRLQRWPRGLRTAPGSSLPSLLWGASLARASSAVSAANPRAEALAPLGVRTSVGETGP